MCCAYSSFLVLMLFCLGLLLTVYWARKHSAVQMRICVTIYDVVVLIINYMFIGITTTKYQLI
jgi:predicted membrane protein